MSYAKPKAGEWVQPVMDGYLMKCCDCELVHRMNFRVVRGPGKYQVQFQVWRHSPKTRKAKKRRRPKP